MKRMFFALFFVLAFMGCSNVIKQEDCLQVKSDCLSVCIGKRFDANGNVIYEKYNDGYEMISEYDERNNCIYENYYGRYIKKTEYDSYNRIIHEIYVTSGAEYWYEYVTFENGSIKTKVIKSNSGYIETREYDILGNGIHWFDNSGYEAWGEYYPDGNVIYFKDSEGNNSLDEYLENR